MNQACNHSVNIRGMSERNELEETYQKTSFSDPEIPWISLQSNPIPHPFRKGILGDLSFSAAITVVE